MFTGLDRGRELDWGEPDSLRPLLEASNGYGLTIVATARGRPRPSVRDFDYVLRLEGDGTVANLVCEQGAPPGGAGRFSAVAGGPLDGLCRRLA